MITMVNLLMVSFKITLITELFSRSLEKWPFLVVMWVIFDTTDITVPTNRYFELEIGNFSRDPFCNNFTFYTRVGGKYSFDYLQ